MSKRIALIEGVRTPMGKASGQLKDLSAVDLGVHCIKSLVNKTNLDTKLIDEVIFGNVSQPVNAANIARVIALKAGLPFNVPAVTVHRNCASGMEAITNATDKIRLAQGSIYIAGGVESMSNIPLLFNKKMTLLFAKISNPKLTPLQKLKILLSFRPNFLKPIIGIVEGLTDPYCGLNMGQTAEVLAKEFKISRKQQDEFALLSHKRAVTAISNKIFDEEIAPIYSDKKFTKLVQQDESPRKEQTQEALQKLRPYFDRKTGTVTVGNSCPISDGGASVLLMSEQKAKQLKFTPLGYLIDYAYAGLEPARMGLGPVYATSKLLDKTNLTMKDFDLIELNEAFAAQVIANEKAFASVSFAKEYLGKEKALGKIDRKKLNVNGGAIALGHPVGMTGTRLVIHLLKELKRRKKKKALATLCIGGGQGGAIALEAK